MKTDDDRKTATAKLHEAYEARSISEQLILLDARPGSSKRERAVLEDLLKLPGVTKRTTIQEARLLKKS
jgi:hypothetical protein